MKILKKICRILITPYLLIKSYINKSTDNVNVYKYTALTKEDKKETDYLCINENIVNNFFIMENKKLISLKTNNFIKYRFRNINKKEINKKELVYFLVQLNTYLKTGNSLINSISLVINKCKYKKLERILRIIRYDLMCGNTLSEALDMQKESFPKLLISVLKDKSISENDHLIEMEEYYKTIYFNEINTTKLNIYKIFIIPYILMISTFILGYIVPKFYKLYKTYLNEELLILKKFLKLKKYDNIMFTIFITLLVIYFVFILLNYNKKIKRKMEVLIIKVMKNNINREMIKYSKTMSLVIKYNLNNLELLNGIIENDYFHNILVESFQYISNKKLISDVLNDKKYISKKVKEMIKSGEKFDSLLLQMNNVNNYYQQKLDNNKKITMSIIGPLIIIFSTMLFGSIIIFLLFQCLMIIK